LHRLRFDTTKVSAARIGGGITSCFSSFFLFLFLFGLFFLLFSVLLFLFVFTIFKLCIIYLFRFLYTVNGLIAVDIEDTRRHPRLFPPLSPSISLLKFSDIWSIRTSMDDPTLCELTIMHWPFPLVSQISGRQTSSPQALRGPCTPYINYASTCVPCFFDLTHIISYHPSLSPDHQSLSKILLLSFNLSSVPSRFDMWYNDLPLSIKNLC
jgi:hypothetical protein